MLNQLIIKHYTIYHNNFHGNVKNVIFCSQAYIIFQLFFFCRSTKQKQKGSATKTTKESARNIGDECEVPTLPGSSTQPNDEHPDDFWPFPFPPAEQESHMNMFEGKQILL